jgi:hypothetical protein
MPRWPENPEDPVDPAITPLIEAGEGESEGFDVAEADLIRHAEHRTSKAPTPSGGTPRASARKKSRDSTTTATARATTRTRKPDRAPRCDEAGDAAGRVATRRLRPTSMSSRSAIEACVVGVIRAPTSASATRPTTPTAVSVWTSSPVTRLQSVARETPPPAERGPAAPPSLLRPPRWRSACST